MNAVIVVSSAKLQYYDRLSGPLFKYGFKDFSTDEHQGERGQRRCENFDAIFDSKQLQPLVNFFHLIVNLLIDGKMRSRLENLGYLACFICNILLVTYCWLYLAGVICE